MIATPLSSIVVIASIGLAGILAGGIAYAARAERHPAVLWIGGGGVVAWFVLAFALAREGIFETDANTAFPAIGPAILVPIVLGSALLAAAPVRRAVARVPLHWLVGVQLYRVLGGVFLVAYLQDDVRASSRSPPGSATSSSASPRRSSRCTSPAAACSGPGRA